MKNVISQSLWLDLVNISVYATVNQNIPLSLREMAIFPFFRIWSSAKPRPMINVILQFLQLDLVNINVSAKFYQNIPNGLRVKFHCFQNLNLGKTSLTISLTTSILIAMCMQSFITIVHSVRAFSLFHNLELNLSQISFDYLKGYIMSISMCMQNFITIFHSVQEIGPFSLFQNLELGKASTDEICHFAISWARSC